MKKTIGKRALGWLLCVCMIVAMIPVLAIPAFAAVYFDNGDTIEEVTNGIVLGETDLEYYDADGNVVLDWDASNLKLTLTNFDFEVAPTSTYPPTPAISIPEDSKLVLNGTNTISSYDSPVVEALGDLVVSGSGSLEINLNKFEEVVNSFTVSNALSENSECALCVDGTLTVNSGTLKCYVNSDSYYYSYDDSHGVCAEVDIIVNGGTLLGEGGYASNSYGIYSAGKMTVNGGNVYGTGGYADYYSSGIYTDGDMTVTGGNVYGTGGEAVGSYGIYTDGDMTVTGGNLYGTGGEASGALPSSMTILVANSYGDPYSYGIYVNEYFRMTAGYLVGYGQTYGLYIDEDYSIASDLIIKGGTSARTTSEIYASQIANYEYIEISEAEEEDATYTVKFDSNGGSSVASQKVVEGKKAGEPIDPTKYGYSFVGWYTDIQLTNKYDFNTKVTSDFTLYAKWQFSGEGDTPPPFTDIDGHWAKTYIEYLSDKGYVQGIGGGLFAPNANMTRAQFVQIVYNAYGNGAVAQAVSFEDVDQSAWYAAAVNWAFEKGIVTGYDDTSFGPNDPVTREQMATMIVRLCNSFGISLTPAKEKYTFADDESIADYAKDAVYALQMCGVVEGKGNNMFAPKDTTTRGEMAKILYLVVR